MGIEIRRFAEIAGNSRKPTNKHFTMLGIFAREIWLSDKDGNSFAVCIWIHLFVLTNIFNHEVYSQSLWEPTCKSSFGGMSQLKATKYNPNITELSKEK